MNSWSQYWTLRTSLFSSNFYWIYTWWKWPQRSLNCLLFCLCNYLCFFFEFSFYFTWNLFLFNKSKMWYQIKLLLSRSKKELFWSCLHNHWLYSWTCTTISTIHKYLSFRQSTWYSSACFSLSSWALETIAFLYLSSISFRFSWISTQQMKWWNTFPLLQLIVTFEPLISKIWLSWVK